MPQLACLSVESCLRPYSVLAQKKDSTQSEKSAEHNTDGKFLVMVRVYGGVQEVEGDRSRVGADGPDALLAVVDEIPGSSISQPTA